MKIINIATGLLPIPPNGWGATEKIIWEYHQNFLKRNIDSQILYLDDVKYNRGDIIHIHIANLALMAKERGIPYYFTCHDHHAYLYGKNSICFKENYDAIKYSIKSFVPAKYLVEYFDLPNLEYLSHGVNSDLFKFIDYNFANHALLCIANNGFIHDQSEDRKGFKYAIEAAEILNLPITIAGPSNNKKFFEKNNFKYNKLNVIYDLTESELIKLYQDHTIFIHPSILEAGHPNLTMLEAMSCGLPVVGTFEENNELLGLVKIKRSTESVLSGIKYVIDNYYRLREDCKNTSTKKSWFNITTTLLDKYNTTYINSMKNQLLSIYRETNIVHREPIEETNTANITFNFSPKIEINGNVKKQYKVQFIDDEKNNVIYETSISNNMWAEANQKYYTNWRIKITELDTQSTIDYQIDLFNKNVKIINESGSLGDFLAWLPIVDLFQKKHNCFVDFYTPHKNLVEDSYKNIKFYNYSDNIDVKYYASYKLGYFNNDTGILAPNDSRTISLQKIAGDILGIKDIEVRPNLVLPDKLENKFNKKYVCIGSMSTAQAKLWNNIGGWDKVVDYLHSLNYEVISIDKHDNIGGCGFYNTIPKNSINKTGDLPLSDRINDLYFCDFFIGLGSGLSWLAWSLNKPVVLISGFSNPNSEFYTPYRVHNNSVCNSCWNDVNFSFDPSKWDWCPRNKDFECSKQITFEMVKEKIDKCILDLNK